MVNSVGTKSTLTLSGDTQLNDGFVLTGKIKATWEGAITGTGGEQLALQVSVD
jgi:hypothetical protein